MDLQLTVRGWVERVVVEAPHNCLVDHGGAPVYGAPLVGFADAADPLFDTLKHPDVVGPDHRSPREWLPDAATVVSYYLPFSEYVRTSCRADGLMPEDWVAARSSGVPLNNALRYFLVDQLTALGGTAMLPTRAPGFAILDRRSNWSERHVAYIAGLGTFGLGRTLITRKGTAGRLGSVITSVQIPPTTRAARTIRDACPFLTDGTCGVCIERCPAHAITKNGKNLDLCDEYQGKMIAASRSRRACVACLTAVPCEDRDPSES